MNILLVHNLYQQPGGEDAVVRAETALLTSAGHSVQTYLRHNDEVKARSVVSKIGLGLRTIWASESKTDLLAILKRFRPDVVHFHNTFPLISPAAYYACKQLSIPVVQTLHNYRIFCPGGTFFRDGKVCEDCLHGIRWRAVRHRCYRRSATATGVVCAMLTFHHSCGTWVDAVDRYIALCHFARNKFVEAGLPAAKVAVKANFVYPDPGAGERREDYALLVGRLSSEKGLPTVLRAWSRVDKSCRLRVIGDGPLRNDIESAISGLTNISVEGRLRREQVLELMRSARLLVFPSECFENFPMSIAEAYACGTPVIASRLGSMREIVRDGRTGLHFSPGDAADLAEKVTWAWEHPDKLAQMGRNARAEFEAKYTAEKNYQALLTIYQGVISGHAVTVDALSAPSESLV